MSLMNCAFTVRWSDERISRTRKPTLPNLMLSEPRNGYSSTAFGA